MYFLGLNYITLFFFSLPSYRGCYFSYNSFQAWICLIQVICGGIKEGYTPEENEALTQEYDVSVSTKKSPIVTRLLFMRQGQISYYQKRSI